MKRLVRVAVWIALAIMISTPLGASAQVNAANRPTSCARAAESVTNGDHAASASDDIRAKDFYQQAVESVGDCEDAWPKGIQITDDIWMIEVNAHMGLLNLFLASGNHDAAGIQYIGAMTWIAGPCLSTNKLIRLQAHLSIATLKSLQPRFPELPFNFDPFSAC